MLNPAHAHFEPYVIVEGTEDPYPGWPIFRRSVSRICLCEDGFRHQKNAIARGQELAKNQLQQAAGSGWLKVRATLYVRERPPGDIATFFPHTKGGVIYTEHFPRVSVH